MKVAKLLFKDLLLDESGQDLIEYALIAGVVGLGAIASLNSLSSAVGNSFTSVGTGVTTNV